jgi:molybdate transport system substrate-binding protein
VLVLLPLCTAAEPIVAEPPASGRTTQPLLVFAGAGFRLPIEAAARLFTERTGIPVETTFAGSGCLLAQAELAGRGDAFIPGEDHYLQQARERGLVETAVPLAYLEPVIAVRRGNPLRLADLADLGRPGLRLGLGDPRSVAVGLATERWIDATLAPDAAQAVRANVRTRALNVNELGSQLALGALDAAIVWDATVALFPDLEAVGGGAGRAHRTAIRAAVLTSSPRPDAARAFVAALADSTGAALFRRFGYEPYAPGTDARRAIDAIFPPGARTTDTLVVRPDPARLLREADR